MTKLPLDKAFTRPAVKLRKDRSHTLKSHFQTGTMLHELVGYFEKMAAKNHERFVFACNTTLMKACRKGKWQPKDEAAPEADRRPQVPFTEREFYFAMAQLRARHIISEQFTVPIGSPLFPSKFHGKTGYLVANVESICSQQDGECRAHFPREYEGKAEDYPAPKREPPKLHSGVTHCRPAPVEPLENILADLREHVRESLARMPEASHQRACPRNLLGDTKETPSNLQATCKQSACINSDNSLKNQQNEQETIPDLSRIHPGKFKNELISVPISVKPETISVPISVSCAPISVAISVKPKTDFSPDFSPAPEQAAQQQEVEVTAQRNGNAIGKAVGCAEPLEPFHSTIGAFESNLGEPTTQTKTHSSNSFSLMNESEKTKTCNHGGEKGKTIGDQFAGWTWKRIEELTDYELNMEAGPFQHYEYSTELEECILATMDDRKDQPFLGRATCASLMNGSMARLRKDYGLDAPACWLPVIRSLRGEQTPTKKDEAEGFLRQPNGRPVFTSRPCPWLPGDAWEMCSDGIRRTKVDREHYG
jgi:hypothetical protein